MSTREVTVRKGRHAGWWVVGRKASGGVFMYTWWPTQGMARAVARWFGWRDDSVAGQDTGAT